MSRRMATTSTSELCRRFLGAGRTRVKKAAQHVPQSGLTDVMCRVEFGRTNERLMAGEVFRVSETFEGADGTLRLGLQGRNSR